MSDVSMSEPRFSISPYFAAYDPAKPSPVATKTVERLLSDAGSFGIYQIGVFAVLGLLSIVPSMVGLSFDVNVGTPDHRCRLSANDSYENPDPLYRDFVQHPLPSNSLYDKRCTMLEPNSTSNFIPCTNGWVFDMKKYGRTLSTDLELVCEKFHLRALTQNVYSAGAAGSLLTGLLSDRWGRRKTIDVLVLLLIFALNTMQLFLYSPPPHQLVVFTFCRFFQGFAITFYSVAIVLLSELTGPSRRVLAANTLAYSYAFGQIVLAITARYFKDYKLTFWALNVYLIPFVSVYLFIPESPRWLVHQNRVREARKIFERIFIVNRRPLNDRMELFYSRLPFDVVAAREAEQKRPTYFNVLKRLVRSKLMRKRCLLLIAVWSVALFVYLGIGSAIPALSDHPFELIIAGAVCEMIGLSICHGLASFIERRRLLVVFFVATALFSSLVPITHPNQTFVSLFLVLLGKLTTSACQLLIVIYTTESYPTALRSTGVGLSACIARLVAMLGPQLSATQYSLWFPLPYIVYSFASLFAAFAASQLPPFHSPCKLPETIHEVEKQEESVPTVAPPKEDVFTGLDQRRPSCTLLRELGVVKPLPVQPLLILPRRHSAMVDLGRPANATSPLPTIIDADEDEEENTPEEIAAPPSMLNRIGSLPSRFFSARRHSTRVHFNLDDKENKN